MLNTHCGLWLLIPSVSLFLVCVKSFRAGVGCVFYFFFNYYFYFILIFLFILLGCINYIQGNFGVEVYIVEKIHPFFGVSRDYKIASECTTRRLSLLIFF